VNIPKRVLITGSSGMLGKDIAEEFSRSDDFDVFGFDKQVNAAMSERNQVIGDLTDFGFLTKSLNQIKPEVVIHCAAIVSIDKCEKDRALADALHREATMVLASYDSDDTRIIYISTDSVFDGSKGNYTEEDVPNPLNYYALSKLEGERAALKQNAMAVVLRTNIYGFHVSGGNSFAEWIIGSLSKGISINGFSDIIFNAIYTKQLARIIKNLVAKSDYRGILNVAGNEYISKYNFMIELAKVFNFSTDLIVESSSNEIKFSIPRPQDTTLNISKLKRLVWIPELAAGLEELKQDYEKRGK